MVDLDEVAQVLWAEPAISLAVVFGSTARGTATARSDVDLAIRLTDHDEGVWSRLEVALCRSASRSVEVVDIDGAPPQLRFEIARDGKVLIERREHAWADFRGRAMIDWWDWQPTARMIHGAAAQRLREQTGVGTH